MMRAGRGSFWMVLVCGAWACAAPGQIAVTGPGLGAVTGHGTLKLVYSDDGTEVASTDVSKEDSQFRFNFVPEGNYTLKASKVREVTREEILNAPGSMPVSTTKETTVRSYKEGSLPLVVHGDLTGVLVKVEAKPAS